MKNQILLNHYPLPGELQEQLYRFVSYYNHDRYHESLDNLTPAYVYYGRGDAVLSQREKIKQIPSPHGGKPIMIGNRHNS